MSSSGMCETKAMHRGVRGSIALLVAASGLIGVSGCGSGGSTATVTPVVQAAYVTTRGPGYRFSMTMATSIGGHNFTIGGEGTIDERHLQGTMSIQGNGKTVTELIKDPYIFIKTPSTGSTALAAGKPWVRANINVYSQAFGSSSPLGGNTVGAKQLLGFLRASGQVTDLGSQTIRGVGTTHYHALVDFSRYAGTVVPSQRAAAQRYADTLQRITGSSSLPMDVWIDAQQRVRRISIQLQICTKEGRLTESMSMDLYDYGRQPAVNVPPASEVTDITDKLKSQVSQGLQQLGC